MQNDKILLAHGGGGKLMEELIQKLFLPSLKNKVLAKLDDSAIIELKGQRIAFTTDSYVVNPIFFKGGDIGKLAVFGTVNDLSMSGAQPLFLSLSLIIEEGLPKTDLEKIIRSVAEAAREAGVEVVTGDTKVVNHGGADKIFINTSGIGILKKALNISGSNARPGDKIILSGSIGDHGITILSQRESLGFETKLQSDCAPLNDLVQKMLKTSSNVHALRDPTRGGLATTLNEFAERSSVGITIYEDKIPVKESVKAACEMLGLDPLYVANEGKLVAVVKAKDAEKILSALKKHKYGKDAQIIGEVTDKNPKMVLMKTFIGGTRIVDTFSGEQLPRIC